VNRHHDARRKLADLYAQIPDVGCRGKCTEFCTSFALPRLEKRLIRRATGVDLGPTHNKPGTPCPLLTADGQCSAYDVRPLICRIWGASRLYPCPHGCRPAGPPLSLRDTYRLLAEAYSISGQGVTARIVGAVAGLDDDTLERIAPTVLGFIYGTTHRR